MRNSVINIDDEYGKKYIEYTNGISYGLEKGDITGKIENISRHGQKVELKIFNNRYETELKLLGKFNLYNLPVLSSFTLFKIFSRASPV